MLPETSLGLLIDGPCQHCTPRPSSTKHNRLMSKCAKTLASFLCVLLDVRGRWKVRSRWWFRAGNIYIYILVSQGTTKEASNRKVIKTYLTLLCPQKNACPLYYLFPYLNLNLRSASLTMLTMSVWSRFQHFFLLDLLIYAYFFIQLSSKQKRETLA